MTKTTAKLYARTLVTGLALGALLTPVVASRAPKAKPETKVLA